MPGSEYPSKIFDRLFGYRSIKAIYDGHVSKNSARGLDHIGIKAFNRVKREQFRIVYSKCKSGDYMFTPYVEKLHSKGRGKEPRIISIATLRDRIVLSLLKEFLHSVFPECVNRTLPNAYIRQIKAFFDSASIPRLCYYKADIKGFYDNIDRQLLLDMLKKKIRSKRVLSLLMASIANPTVPASYKRTDRKKFKTSKGIPQGLAISNILANIYLSEFDVTADTLGYKYLRYVDDVFIFTEETRKENVKTRVEDELCMINLELSSDKTCCDLAGCKVDYLGYKFELPKISIRDINVEKFINSIAAKITSFNNNSSNYRKKHGWLTKEVQKLAFVEDINEKITGAISDKRRYGWLMYFMEINDMQLLHKLDNIIQGFFTRLDDFDHRPPSQLKKLSTAYYKAKHDISGGYIHDYKIYDSVSKKARYLRDRGLLNPKETYTKEEIENLFARIKKKHLSRLDLDVGLIS